MKKFEGTLTVKKGAQKVKVVFPEDLGHKKYATMVSILDPKEFDRSNVISVNHDKTRNEKGFVIVFSKKLESKTVLHWAIEVFE